MKSFAAAAILWGAHSQDAASLMQGLMRHSQLNVEGSGSGTVHRRDATSKLMETATRMMKNGVTPDVVEFIETTITEVNQNVLGEITFEYNADQTYIDSLLQRLQDTSDTIPNQSVYDQQAGERTASSDEHKQCRSEEAVHCARSRKCEEELKILWNRVKSQETEMRRIHDAIHGEWCLRDDFNPHPPTPTCWDWPLSDHWEGPETSQSVEPYCTTDVSANIRDFRLFSVEHFTSYIAQKVRVSTAWEEYNAKIILCAQLEQTLDTKVNDCDGKQAQMHEQVCHDASSNRQNRRLFAQEWESVLNTYFTAVGDCRLSDTANEPYNANKTICDANAVPHDDRCKCRGILQEEQDRKREWETLHIVTCLLETVYTHVIHAIETDEPCPTTQSNPEQVESEINYCHVIERSMTANLTHHYCLDRDLPYNMEGCLPDPPHFPPVIEPPCTSQYIWQEQGFFTDVIQASYAAALAAEADLGDHYTALSAHGWAGCAAPLVCVHCEGLMAQNADAGYTDSSAECRAHESYLQPGQNNGETFRCLGLTTLDSEGHELHWPDHCVPARARCNGHNNCGDNSDELHCETLWGVPADLRLASTEECRAGATVVPASSDDVQFFCASGACTSIESRCNGFDNCGDGSDELGCPSGSVGLTVEATTGFTVTTEVLSAQSSVFHDRDYIFDSLGSLSGMTYIKSSNEDKHTSQTHVQMKLRLPQPMTVYVAKLPNHELTWLSELGAEGSPLWRVSELQGASYRGTRMTGWTEWQMGAPADYEPGNYQTNEDGMVQHEDWAHSRSSEALNQGFLNGDPAASRAGTLTERNFGPTVVYERTFAAGVVSMPGNSGGDGSYLMLVANPNTPPEPPVLPPTGNAEYLGCFFDDSARDLGSMESGGASYTYATCLLRCQGHRFMSLQYGGECFCADAYGTAPQYVQVVDSQCNMVREPCTSSGTHNCGGTWHQAIYAIGNLGNEIMLQYSNPSFGANGLCVSMSHNSGGDAGCDEISCIMRGESDATMQTCDSSDAGQKYIHDTHSGQLRSSLGVNRCLHVSTSSTHGGCEPFTLQPCMAHETRQQFNLESHAGTTVWRNVATNLAIDSNSYRNTVDNWIWACGGTNTAKYFDAVSTGADQEETYTVDGCTRGTAGEHPLTMHTDAGHTADVRCCSMDGSTCQSGHLEGGEDYYHNGASTVHTEGCVSDVSHAQAMAVCAAGNMRLCNTDEVQACCGTGCYHDHHSIWVSINED